MKNRKSGISWVWLKMHEITIAIGTQNTAKIRGIERAFRLYFPNTEIRSSKIPAPSLVSDLPLSEDECLHGAHNRALYCLGNISDSAFSVGIESGLRRIGGRYLAMATYTYMIDAAGSECFGASSSHVIAIESDIQSSAFLDQFNSGRQSISEYTQGAYGLIDKSTESTICALAMRAAFALRLQ